MQEDEYWAEFDKESVQAGADEEELEDERVILTKYHRLFGPQNSITANNSAIHYNSSPYSYVLNNPISYIDPLGLDTVNKLKQVNIVGKSNSVSPLGEILVGMTVNFPKSWLGLPNTGSKVTNLLSSGMSKVLPQVMKARRYTHTNAAGSKIYTKVLGRFLGRWAVKILEPAGWVLTGWDVATMGLPPAGYDPPQLPNGIVPADNTRVNLIIKRLE